MKDPERDHTIVPIPEVRELVAAAKQYVAGEIHYSALIRPMERCDWWSQVSRAHPAIRSLTKTWMLWIDQVWNEYRQHPVSLSEAELRQRIARDLNSFNPTE